MGEVEHIDIKEFQQLGFLQEANRQSHPHGLALEITTWRDDEDYVFPMTYVGLDATAVAAVRALLAGEAVDQEVRDKIVQAVEAGEQFQPGSCYISGVWDYRDDPEGIVFGSVAMATARSERIG